MLRIILLICAVSTPPSQCDRDHAYSITQAGVARTPHDCMSGGLAMSAANQLRDENSYAKVVCERP